MKLSRFSKNLWFILAILMSEIIFESLAVKDFPQLDYVKTKYVCQNDSVKLNCPSPSLLEIQAASFGRAMSAICATGANADKTCDLLDMKLILKQMCDYKSDCKVVASAETLGNHCPEVDKYLNIIFACVSNPDVEYPKTNPTTKSPPTTLPSTTQLSTALPSTALPSTALPSTALPPTTEPPQPTTANLTTPSLTGNFTQTPNSTSNVTTTTTKPLATPRRPRKKINVPQTSIRFNPDGPELDFLAKSGESSIIRGRKSTHLMLVICPLVLGLLLHELL